MGISAEVYSLEHTVAKKETRVSIGQIQVGSLPVSSCLVPSEYTPLISLCLCLPVQCLFCLNYLMVDLKYSARGLMSKPLITMTLKEIL